MTFERLKGKIHRATVIQAELDYVGSITVDEDLLDAAGILEYEKVQIVDIDNGEQIRNLYHLRRAGQWNDLPEWCGGKMRKYRRQSNYYGLWTL